jgi:MinD-like ATPase involved in chromosome partitioning or flagellar assembly
MDQIQSLHDALSAADAQQGTVMTANAQSTVDRAALFRTLKTMTGYAAKVAQSVFGKTSRQAQSLADPRPLTNRGAKRRAATKAKKLADKVAKKTAKAAKRKDYAAAAKRRAKRAAVAARATSLAEPVTPTKKANAKAAKKKPSR